MINNQTESVALSILSATPYLGPIKIQLLVKHFGTAVCALDAEPKELALLPGFTPKVLSRWKWWDSDRSWEQNLELVEKHQVEMIPFTSSRYPKRLREVVDHPILLYVKGEIKREDQRSLAVIGTRVASIYGLEMAERLSESLAYQKFTVVSGLARGVDTHAHEGALKGGRTIAVIGSGLAHVYPRENIPLSERIVDGGALISEFPMAMPPDRQNFPRRNRIVSGMTLGSLLIEAPEKSGAMITMERAEQQGRKLFALPGRADQESFRGNHRLIKDGRAQLVENVQDIGQTFDDLFVLAPKKKSHTLPPLENEEKKLLQSLPSEELSVEDIVNLTKLPVFKINILLMSLVVKKMIKEYPGRVYRKLDFGY